MQTQNKVYAELGYSETLAQTHQDDIKEAKAGLYLKLGAGVKTTGTSAGYNDRKKKIKETKSSYPMEEGPSSKNIWGRLIYSVSFASVFTDKVYCQCSWLSVTGYS